MSQANYGPTPPILLPSPDGSERPASPDAGTMKTFDNERMSLGYFSDAALHFLALTRIKPSRCVEVEVYVEAMDPAGGRLASGSAKFQVARLGNAGATIVGTPLMLTYTPNLAPWAMPTVRADLVVVPLPLPAGSNIAVQVLGLAGVPIRWRATVKVIGAQAQLTA